MPKLRIHYNAPVVLTFSLLATAVTLLAMLDREVLHYFSAPARFDFLNPLFYFRLVSHVLGHDGWTHLVSNLAIILLVGPLMEERYGIADTVEMIAITAIVTALLNAMLFDTSLLGASGVAFMLILLAAAGTLRGGGIPLTFVLVAVLFLGREVAAAVGDRDRVSQLAHIAGAACGAVFGFTRAGRTRA